MIEQAIFTSAQTERSRGYQLVAVSPGIDADDARELTTWGPSHGSLSEADCGGSSVNLHPLPSGRWCVAETVAAGEEYSGRGGMQVYTRMFVLSADEMARFANNPFAVLRAARSHGLLEIDKPLPRSLAAVELPGRTPPVDEGLLAEFADLWGAKHVAWLIETALGADSLLVVGADNRDALVAGLLNCLPVECRPELSFATGLAHSLRRPFRVNALAIDGVELRRLKRQPGVTLLDLRDQPPHDFQPSGWAEYVLEAIEMDRLTDFSAELGRPRPGLRLSDLSWLAAQLTERLREGNRLAPPETEAGGRGWRGELTAPPGALAGRLAHAAHARFESQLTGRARTATIEQEALPRPSEQLDFSHESLERLEHLDDLVFDTINGRRPSLDELSIVWPRLAAELPQHLMQESREQYLHYAIKVWETSVADGLRDPQRAVAALDVLCLLFSGDA